MCNQQVCNQQVCFNWDGPLGPSTYKVDACKNNTFHNIVNNVCLSTERIQKQGHTDIGTHTHTHTQGWEIVA